MKFTAVALLGALCVSNAFALRQLTQSELAKLEGVPAEWHFMASLVSPELSEHLLTHGRHVAEQKGLSVEELFRNELEPQLLMDSRAISAKAYFSTSKRQSSFSFSCPAVAVVNGTSGIPGCDRSKCEAVDPPNDSPKCDWYNSKGCCTKEAIDEGYAGLSASLSLAGQSEGDSCFDYQMLSFCGNMCSPDQTAVNPADPTSSSLTPCKDFCHDGISACEDVTVAGMDATQETIDAAKAQCDAAPTSNCFNSAASLQASFALIVVALLAAFAL